MKPLYINKKSHWHCQRQKASIILLASDFVTWTARYRLDLVFCLSYTDYKFICYLLLFSICLFVAAIYLFTRNLSPSCEISLNLVKTVLAFLFFFLLEASFTSRSCISCWIRFDKCWLYSQKQPSTVFLPKAVLKICSKRTREHPCWSVISMKSHFGKFVLL